MLRTPTFLPWSPHRWRMRSAALLLLGLLVACGRPAAPATTPPPDTATLSPPSVTASPSPGATSPPATPRPTYDAVAFSVTVGVVASTLVTATPIRGLSPAKAAMEQDRDTYQRALATTVVLLGITPITDEIEPTLPPRTPLPGHPRRAAGAGTIIEDNSCSHQKVIGAQNRWFELKGPQVLIACAGTSYFRPIQAEVMLALYDDTTSALISGPDVYPVPAPVLWVKVIDAVGEQLILQADTGALFAFDVPTRQWIAVPPRPSPSPGPSPRPSPSP